MKALTDVAIKPPDFWLFRGFDPGGHAIQFVEQGKIGRGPGASAAPRRSFARGVVAPGLMDP